MPARHFDRTVVRAVRRAAEIPQAEVGAAVDAADSTVAGWELGSSVPDQEKLPGIARVLRKPLDELFPRKGTPDLIDLRCDAGLYRYEVARFIGTKSDGPVAAAENGVRRLKEKYVTKLAAAYGVSEKALERAANGEDELEVVDDTRRPRLEALVAGEVLVLGLKVKAAGRGACLPADYRLLRRSSQITLSRPVWSDSAFSNLKVETAFSMRENAVYDASLWYES